MDSEDFERRTRRERFGERFGKRNRRMRANTWAAGQFFCRESREWLKRTIPNPTTSFFSLSSGSMGIMSFAGADMSYPVRNSFLYVL